MTIIVGWIPFEMDGEHVLPTSAYLASDSRVTQDGYNPIDCSQKLFVSQSSPDIFGFTGDVISGVTIIQYLLSLLSVGWAKDTASIEERFELFFEQIKNASIFDRKVWILHFTRKGKRGFGCCKYSIMNGEIQMDVFTIITDKPRPFLIVEGTGKEEYMNLFISFSKGNSYNTGRNVFQALCAMIERANTPSCGGMIQLTGLYQEGYGRSFGFVQDGTVWFSGHRLPEGLITNNIELRNRLFERCDPHTLELLKGAQAQPNELM